MEDVPSLGEALLEPTLPGVEALGTSWQERAECVSNHGRVS